MSVNPSLSDRIFSLWTKENFNMHMNIMILNSLKVPQETPAFWNQSQGPQDLQDTQAVLAPKVHLVSIRFVKSGTWHQMAPWLT